MTGRIPLCRHLRRIARHWITAIVALQFVAVVVYYRSSSNKYAVRSSKFTDVDVEDTAALATGVSSAHYPPFDTARSITLKDDSTEYFSTVGSAGPCFVEGTDVQSTMAAASGADRINVTDCVCRADYFGRDCGIPAAVWHRTLHKKYDRWKLTQRKVPRRIIHGLNINHELDFLQVRLEELQDAVDAYIICESNYTANGQAKPFHLLDRLRAGFLDRFHSRMVYVPLTRFPAQGHKDGWFVDMYLRTYMGLYGLKKLRDVRPDDLFVLLDADEIPTREVLLFLKLYDGYPEPVRLAMRWSVFGFFWKRKQPRGADSLIDWVFSAIRDEHEYEEELLEVTAVSTMAMVWEVCQNNTFLIRKDMSAFGEFQDRLSRYRHSRGDRRVQPWTAGTREKYAGFHCSWCYSPEGIRTKLLSAHVDDKPRWGDYPEKLDLDYLRGLIRNGEWFDGSHPFLPADFEKEEQYAPNYVLQHQSRFKNLLYPSTISNSID